MIDTKKLCTYVLILLTSGHLFAQDEPQINLRRIKLQAGMHLIDTQLAITPQQRQIGLMFRKEMPAHEGMLFVFESKNIQCFWKIGRAHV